MPIANATAILQALPLAVALAAWAVLKEPLGWRRLGAISIGFTGVIMIVQPGGEGFTIWSIYALLAVGFITLRDLIVRKMSRDTPVMTVAFSTAVAITLTFGLGAIASDWAPVSSANLLSIVLAAVFIFAGYILAVSVMRVGEISFVAPFRYTGLIWALAAGVLVFGEWPDTVTMIGALIVVFMGLFTLFRERQISQRHID
jgi:S-adenosylmethionine uptake transporter